MNAAEAKRARDRLRYAKKTGKKPRPGDLETVRKWKQVTSGLPAPDVGAPVDTASHADAVPAGDIPAPSSTTEIPGGAIPELPAPDVGAAPDADATSDDGQSTGATPDGSAPASGAAPTSGGPTPNAAGALPGLYRGLLQGLNEAARQRECWFTLPEPSIDVLTLYAAEVLAPYEAQINKPALVLGAPVVLGVQILVHDAMAKRKKAKEERERRAAMGLDPDPAPPPPPATETNHHAAPPSSAPDAPPASSAPKRGPLGWAG